MAVKGSKDAIIEKRILQKDEMLWFSVIMTIDYWPDFAWLIIKWESLCIQKLWKIISLYILSFNVYWYRIIISICKYRRLSVLSSRNCFGLRMIIDFMKTFTAFSQDLNFSTHTQNLHSIVSPFFQNIPPISNSKKSNGINNIITLSDNFGLYCSIWVMQLDLSITRISNVMKKQHETYRAVKYDLLDHRANEKRWRVGLILS